MPDFSQAVTLNFVGVTVAIIFVIIAIGIFGVQKFKKEV